MGSWSSGDKITAAKLNAMTDILRFANDQALFEYDSSGDSTTVTLEPTTDNNRMALHVKPTGAGGGITNYGALLALWNRNINPGVSEEVFELTWEGDVLLFNTFKVGSGTARDVVFWCDGAEVARMKAATERFSINKLQIPNNSPIFFVDNSENERAKIYVYTNNDWMFENTMSEATKFATSEHAGFPADIRLVLNGGAALGSAGIEVYENLKMQTVSAKYQSIELPVKAGTLSDADFNDPQNGLVALDSSNGRIYFRHGGNWHYVNQTAGFEIPKEEKTCPVCGKAIKTKDFVCGQIDGEKSDGALHGVYVHLKCAVKD